MAAGTAYTPRMERSHTEVVQKIAMKMVPMTATRSACFMTMARVTQEDSRLTIT